MTFDATLNAMDTFSAMLHQVAYMEEGFVERYRKQTTHAQCAQTNHKLIPVFAAAKKDRQTGYRQHEKKHPEMEVLMNPEGGGHNGKYYQQ